MEQTKKPEEIITVTDKPELPYKNESVFSNRDTMLEEIHRIETLNHTNAGIKQEHQAIVDGVKKTIEGNKAVINYLYSMVNQYLPEDIPKGMI